MTMARKLHLTLEPGDVVLIPPGQAASVTFIEKSGRRSKVTVECEEPVTITRARGTDASQKATSPLIAKRPVPAM